MEQVSNSDDTIGHKISWIVSFIGKTSLMRPKKTKLHMNSNLKFGLADVVMRTNSKMVMINDDIMMMISMW